MGLYSRDDYERDCRDVENMRARARSRVAVGRMDGFKYKKIDEECDALLKSFKGKLRATALILQENEQKQNAIKQFNKGGIPPQKKPTLKELNKLPYTYQK
jgi:hypothetical protein